MIITINSQPAYAYTGGKAFNAQLPTAVFIHGAQNDHSVWALQTRYFAHHGFSVLAVDLPDHGRSKGQPLNTVEAMADWLNALLQSVGVQRAVLIGHSMGSLIALETANRAKALVAGVALVGTAFPMKVSPLLLEASEHRITLPIDASTETYEFFNALRRKIDRLHPAVLNAMVSILMIEEQITNRTRPPPKRLRRRQHKEAPM